MDSQGPKASSCGQRRLWSDLADLSLCWAHSHFVGFVMSQLNYTDTSDHVQQYWRSPYNLDFWPWPLSWQNTILSTTILPRTWKHTYLLYSKLKDNNIAIIESEAFSGVMVTSLDLTSNPLRQLNIRSFFDMTLSETLSINGMMFTEIPSMAFYDVTANTVDIQAGGITDIKSEAFYNLQVQNLWVLAKHCFVFLYSFLCPQLRRSWQGILVSGCPCIRPCILSKHACHILWTVHARVLKFHLWIPHGKIADTHFFLDRVISLSGVMPLCKHPNEIGCMPYLMNHAF